MPDVAAGSDRPPSTAPGAAGSLPRHPDAADPAILDAIPAQIAVLDMDGVILSVNDTWRAFGDANALRVPRHGVGANYLAICDRATGDHAEGAGAVAAGIRSVLERRVAEFSIEYPCHSATEQRWFRLVVKPLGADPHSGVIVIHQNVTHLQHARDALAELARTSAQEGQRLALALEIERSRLAATQRVAGMGSWETDLATLEVVWSDQTHRIHETDPATFEPTHQKFLEFVHPEDRAAVEQAFRASLGRHATSTAEHRLLLPGGRIKFVEEHWQVVYDGQGRPIRAVGTCQDITARREAERSAHNSENQFRVLTEAMPQMVWITRPDGWNVYSNQRWLDYTGQSPEASAGHGWHAHLHPDDIERSDQVWRQAVASATAYSVENRIRRADGVYRWWLTRGVPVLDAGGRVIEWIGTCTDIDELKQAELEVTRTNHALRQSEIRVKYLNRVYAMLSAINTLIVRVRDRDELFREACRIAVEAGGFRMSLIGIMDEQARRIVPVASAGKHEALMALIEKRLASDESARDTMIARAMREKRAVVANDSPADPQVVFGPVYAESGVRSMVVLPLLVADTAVGVIALYAGEPEFFHDDELKLLRELADDVAFAIDHLEKQERLDYLAHFDALTGLANRTLFLGRVAQFLRSAASSECKVALCLIDLERFKNLNDALGQAAGDALLRQVAGLLKGLTDDPTVVARVGADHFAVVLPDISQAADGARFVERSLQDFLEHPFVWKGSTFRVGAKVGIALFPDDGSDAAALFRNAEAALKMAKAGGDRYLFYTQKLTAAVAGRLTLENQLRLALEREEFVLHYQPKVSLANGRITGAEALIRWNDPHTGLVAPGHFIPIMEEVGLINEVGRWALRKAVEDYLRWCAAGLPAVRIAVNVSSLQLRDPGFVAEIEQVVGVDARAAAGLELEITESVLMGDVQRSTGILGRIRALGVTVAIDDFGTGFSSLSYLSKLRVDTLKIDRSFVADMTSGHEGLSLLSMILSLAQSLRLTVVAEGVETVEQARLLRLLRCEEMQGFLVSKALPVADFESRFLRGEPWVAPVAVPAPD